MAGIIPRLGTASVAQLRSGTAAVARIYRGSTLLYEPVSPEQPQPQQPSPNATLAMNGLFYGVDAPVDASANSVYKYRRPTGARFRAEITGHIVAIRWNHRVNYADRGEVDGTSNYSNGDGGTIRIEVRKNDPALEHPPLGPSSDPFAPLAAGDANLLGRTADRGGDLLTAGNHPTMALTTIAPVTAGQRYWIVFNQLNSSNWVSANSAHIKGWITGNTQSDGGPYWGSDLHIARSGTNTTAPASWLYENGTSTEETRHLVKMQLKYRLPDNSEIWSGFGCVFANGAKGAGTDAGSQRGFSNLQPIRMQFTPARSNFTTSRIWFRAYRRETEATAPGNMRIRIYRGTTLLSTATKANTAFVKTTVQNTPIKPPVPFISFDLPSAITIQSGQQHYIVFDSISGEYVTHAQQIDLDPNEFMCRNTFQDGHAQFSTDSGGSWSTGWHFGANANSRTDFVLPFLLEVAA